ncbi:MAG TPA: MgtC/SapB family protein [Mycobacterium sp.]|nr:MgtC/SapB family protein [Mycobacterium sp.]
MWCRGGLPRWWGDPAAGFTVQGLTTAATLWCSAAVGCQAAGGHLLPAVELTDIVLSIHTVLRHWGRWWTKSLR